MRKCRRPVTVALPPLGIRSDSWITRPSSSVPVTTAVVASQSAELERVSVTLRGGNISPAPTTPSKLAAAIVCAVAAEMMTAAVAMPSASATSGDVGGRTSVRVVPPRMPTMPAAMAASAITLLTSRWPLSASWPAMSPAE